MHCLILGMTLSGKTTWAKKKVAALKKLTNRKVIVLDTISDPAWNADFITDDPDLFLKVFWASEHCIVVVDESGDSIGKYNEVMNQIATRGRHWGHKVFFICQRAGMISKTIRAQCSELVLFKSHIDDTKELARVFCNKQINEAENLNHGEYIYIRHNQPVVKSNVFSN